MRIELRAAVRPLCLTLAALALASGSSFADGAAVKGEMMTWIKDAESKLTQLSEAMPEGKYAWRPSKGVRSVGEVYMHVAAANYGLAGFAGVTPPAGFDFEKFEGSKTKKAEIVQTLKDSFAHMENGLANMTDEDMEKPTEFFGMKTTYRGAYMLLLSHCHEHLGQSIAYARSNGVTPPWTAAQEKAAAAKKAEGEKMGTK